MDFLAAVKKLAFYLLRTAPEDLLREKRDSQRKLCYIKGVNTYKNGSTVPLVIRDIGFQGIQVQADTRLAPGSCILVSAHDGGGVLDRPGVLSEDTYMKVIWCRKIKENYLAGLRFTNSAAGTARTWVSELLEACGLFRRSAAHRRKNIRLSSDMPLSLNSLDDGRMCPGRVIDIGPGGMLISTEKPLRAQEVLRLRVGPHESLGTFICRGRIAHCRFHPHRRKWVAGVNFERLDEDQSRHIIDFLGSLLFQKKMSQLI
jgi:hypothetical protein